MVTETTGNQYQNVTIWKVTYDLNCLKNTQTAVTYITIKRNLENKIH